ncbi:MAG: hypothetical protein IPL21_16210 [Saprospirales bacterium]|nr:hypothetical protein [Saprospirales bacterium]
MQSNTTHIIQPSIFKVISLKYKDIVELTKLRLSLLVVFSAVMSYLLSVKTTIIWADIIWLF